tara:strand:+ start:1833 stop:2378 length:546 start_codon:yes stop_codon:yes gene_type:complete
MNGGKWSTKYKNSINCKKPKGFSQKQYCKHGRKKSTKPKKSKKSTKLDCRTKKDRNKSQCKKKINGGKIDCRLKRNKSTKHCKSKSKLKSKSKSKSKSNKELKLYKPVKSNRKHKKYMVLTKKGVIHFGDNRYQQYKDKIGIYSHLDHNDKERRKRYYDRHGDKNTKNKESAKYWSHKILW